MLRDLLENASLLEIIATIVAIGLIIATILSLIYIIVGGIAFILSAGNEEKIRKAIHTIRFSIIGLFVSFIAFFIVRFLTVLLDIPFDLTFSTVIDLVADIFDSLQ